MNRDCGHHMLWIKVELTRLKSTWKLNSRSVRMCRVFLFIKKLSCPFCCFWRDCYAPAASTTLTLSPFLSWQQYKPVGAAHNRRAQPFIAAANIDDKRQVVSSAYNTPIGLYSSGNIQDAMEGQMRGLVQQPPLRWWLSLYHLLDPNSCQVLWKLWRNQ